MLKESSALALLAGLAVTANAGIGNDVIVTEVFFNPSGDEAETEWVEITNVGLIPVDVSNWRLADEDNNSPSDPFGSGAIFDPNSQTIIPGAEAQGTDGLRLRGRGVLGRQQPDPGAGRVCDHHVERGSTRPSSTSSRAAARSATGGRTRSPTSSPRGVWTPTRTAWATPSITRSSC
jgi:hypothetical protein